MANYSLQLNQMFLALGDPTRRAIVSRLGQGTASVKELAAPFGMALPSFMKHLGVLERCGLVRSRKAGRVRLCELAPQPLESAEQWLGEQRALWEGRTDRLASFVQTLHAKEQRMSAEHPFDLRITRLLRAPRALVWKAWSDPAHLKQWWCPKPWTTDVRAFEFTAGGAFHTFMQGPDGGTSDNPGVFLEVTPQSRIVFTTALVAQWRPANEPWLPMTAIITMADEGSDTRYTALVLHKDQATRDRHEEMGFHEGWGTCITQLEAYAGTLG